MDGPRPPLRPTPIRGYAVAGLHPQTSGPSFTSTEHLPGAVSRDEGECLRNFSLVNGLNIKYDIDIGEKIYLELQDIERISKVQKKGFLIKKAVAPS